MTLLAGLTWPEAAALADAVLVVPLGSTEQHGPHLPLSTDTDVATALAVRVAATRTGVVVAPALPYGASGEHAGFPGTLSLGTAALQLLLVELVRSADHFARVLLLSGHGGNADAVNAAVRQLRSESRDVRAWAPRWRGDAHAGRTETAVQLALAGRVLQERAEPGDVRPLADVLPLLRSGGVAAVSPNGVLGDPAGATAAQGAELLAAAVAELAAVLDAWAA